MTAKLKANSLFDKFKPFVHNTSDWNEYDSFLEIQNAKQCTRIAVEELIKEQTMWQNGDPNPVLYWQDVLKEIEKL